MRTFTLPLGLIFTAMTLSACASASQPPPIGGDRDSHGCLPSAGYSWCESKQKCLRNWEEECPASSSSLEACTPEDCSPIVGKPNSLCEDGSLSGPICTRIADGSCEYVTHYCPEDLLD